MSGVSPSKRGDIDALLSSSTLSRPTNVAKTPKRELKTMEPELSGLGRAWALNTAIRDRVAPQYGPGVKDAVELAILAALSES
jgi:hypothetical protein